MDGKNIRQQYVVALLRNNTPIAFVTITPDGDDTDSIDIDTSPASSYSEIAEQIATASRAIGFLVWKETGQLPLPTGYSPSTGDSDVPW